MKKFKVGSTDWTDEHSVNILDDDGHLIAKTIVSPYADFEQAAINAQLLISGVNNWDVLKEQLFRLRQIEQPFNGPNVFAYNEILSLIDKIETRIFPVS